jgi:hypothetical protein
VDKLQKQNKGLYTERERRKINTGLESIFHGLCMKDASSFCAAAAGVLTALGLQANICACVDICLSGLTHRHSICICLLSFFFVFFSFISRILSLSVSHFTIFSFFLFSHVLIYSAVLFFSLALFPLSSCSFSGSRRA